MAATVTRFHIHLTTQSTKEKQSNFKNRITN